MGHHYLDTLTHVHVLSTHAPRHAVLEPITYVHSVNDRDPFDWDMEVEVEIPRPKEKDFTGVDALREAGRARRQAVVSQLWEERVSRKASGKSIK